MDSTKIYVLAAWTEGDSVKFTPTISRKIEEDFRRRLAKLNNTWQFRPDEIERLLAVSREYERFGDFMLESGHAADAFVQFAEAATVCICCTDRYWFCSGGRFTVCRELRQRFELMYDRCSQLRKLNPHLDAMATQLDLDRRAILGPAA